ncbi:MAG: DNA repair protein RecO [Eubacteriaceae bacterium]|jgi:DNA repair protein RecO (recombination protein O)|nr:DNA repair protein RecO [Eubacteriaceae bacterium]
MFSYSDGIILRQTKILGGRRMILLFTRDLGKISAGTRIDEKSKSKSALAMRPFVYGRYEIRDVRDNKYISSGEVIRSHYKIGEDIDKFMMCSYALEFAGKLALEDMPMPGLFDITAGFLDAMETRKSSFGTLLLAYIVKAMAEAGYTPETGHCVSCGKDKPAAAFSVKDGGIICEDCLRQKKDTESLIYEVDFGIVGILRYFLDNPFESFERLALEESKLKRMREIMKQYSAYYLDLGDLKSESFLADE